jgi:hypothetical protein
LPCSTTSPLCVEQFYLNGCFSYRVSLYLSKFKMTNGASNEKPSIIAVKLIHINSPITAFSLK